jgi:hypothetical protein
MPTNPNLRTFTILAPREWCRDLKRTALESYMSMSEFVRQAVDEKMARLAAEKENNMRKE